MLAEAARQLTAYFARDLKEFDLPLAPRGTDFQQRVWAQLRTIGWGETASYGAIALRLGRGVVHQLKPHDPEHHRRPQVNVATQDARWFSLCNVDGVTVTTADGRGVVYRQRDREKMFELLRESLKRQALLSRKFAKMRKVYRSALPMLTSTRSIIDNLDNEVMELDEAAF